MGLETAALIAAGASTGANIYGNWQQNRRTNREIGRRNRLAEQYATPMMQQGDVPGLEWLENLLAGDRPTLGEGFNVGQDSLMQSLRNDPRTLVHSNLEGIMETGDPFDTSELFKTLGALDTRHRQEALADVRGSAGGLGQRFGSSMRNAENDLVAQLLEQSGARNAQIAMGSHEAAQGRRLQAANQLSGRETADTAARTQMAQILSQLGLQEGEFGQRNEQLTLQGLAQLIGGQQQGRQQNLGALSLLLGLPLPQGYNPGGDMMDLSQLLLLAGDLQQRRKESD